MRFQHCHGEFLPLSGFRFCTLGVREENQVGNVSRPGALKSRKMLKHVTSPGCHSRLPDHLLKEKFPLRRAQLMWESSLRGNGWLCPPGMAAGRFFPSGPVWSRFPVCPRARPRSCDSTGVQAEGGKSSRSPQNMNDLSTLIFDNSFELGQFSGQMLIFLPFFCLFGFFFLLKSGQILLCFLFSELFLCGYF